MGVSMGGEPSIITVTFDEIDGMTKVATMIKYASKTDRDEAFATGMTDGMEMNYKRLDEMLAVLKKDERVLENCRRFPPCPLCLTFVDSVFRGFLLTQRAQSKRHKVHGVMKKKIRWKWIL